MTTLYIFLALVVLIAGLWSSLFCAKKSAETPYGDSGDIEWFVAAVLCLAVGIFGMAALVTKAVSLIDVAS